MVLDPSSRPLGCVHHGSRLLMDWENPNNKTESTFVRKLKEELFTPKENGSEKIQAGLRQCALPLYVRLWKYVCAADGTIKSMSLLCVLGSCVAWVVHWCVLFSQPRTIPHTDAQNQMHSGASFFSTLYKNYYNLLSKQFLDVLIPFHDNPGRFFWCIVFA